MESETERVCQPYGNVITKILKCTKFNCEDEEYKEHIRKIGKLVLATMRFEIINGKAIEKPTSNENKRKTMIKNYS